MCSLAPTSPASSVTRRSTAVCTSSSPGWKTKVPAASSVPTRSRVPSRTATSSSVRMPALPRPFTWAREPSRSTSASTWSKWRLTVKAATSSAMPPPSRPCQRVTTGQPDRAPRSVNRAGGPGRAALAGGPGGHAQAPEPDEALGVGVPERVAGVVGGQLVVVEGDRAATPVDGQGARRLETQPDLTGDVALGLGHEGVEGRLERREPQAVVDQLGPARLEPGLLVVEVTLEGQVLEVGVGGQEGQRAGALVDLPALDPHPAVLDHVEAAEPGRAGQPSDLGDERVRLERPAVEGHRDVRPRIRVRTPPVRWRSAGSACRRRRAGRPRDPR